MRIERAFTKTLCLSVGVAEEREKWVAPDPRFFRGAYDPFNHPDLLDSFLNVTDVRSFRLFVLSWGPLAGPAFLKIAAFWAFLRIKNRKGESPLALIKAGWDAELELAKIAVKLGYTDEMKDKRNEAVVFTILSPLGPHLPVATKWAFNDEKIGFNFTEPTGKIPISPESGDVPVLFHFENAEEAVRLATKAREALEKGNINLFWSWFHDNTRWSVKNGWLRAEALNLLSPIAYHALYASTKGLFTLRTCSLCSRYFVPAKKTQKYCSYSCQTRAKTKRYRERLKGEE